MGNEGLLAYLQFSRQRAVCGLCVNSHFSLQVLVHIEEQSPDIGQGVHGLGTKTLEEVGAGDQGHMFGYATDETEQLMPLTHVLATQLGYKLTEVCMVLTLQPPNCCLVSVMQASLIATSTPEQESCGVQCCAASILL